MDQNQRNQGEYKKLTNGSEYNFLPREIHNINMVTKIIDYKICKNNTLLNTKIISQGEILVSLRS